ncbi:class I SAM-dependent methyltransferase [Hyalangium gracile]|uniref:hypothetical protein n=1 Tax=Hyalangium gracile TaxID=394092 RepID=UPI001CC8F69A|nr:hypothetical protein [Hyalangium gracile]
MLPTERLNLLWLDVSQNPDLLAQLRKELDGLFQSSRYQRWLKEDSRTPFTVSGLQALEQVGLLVDGRLQVKVNRIGDRLFITDGAWVSHLMRVFPDPDESLLLLDTVRQRGLRDWASWVIDPAAGCGHTPIGFPGPARRVSCDANARAILYASLNARLNGLGPDQFTALLNDMTQGFPPSLRIDGNVLFLANVPFAPSPRRGALALNSAGGRTGADLQLASFRLVRRFHDTYRLPVKACFLTWTVGSQERDTWEVPQLCRELFPGRSLQWSIVQHDYDAPELPNPAPVTDTLRYLASSQYAVQPGERGVEAAYAELSRELLQQGHTHVAYGLLELDLS